MINDFNYNPNYQNMETYDSYELLKKYISGSWYDQLNKKPYNEKFFDVLNFGSDNLGNAKTISGRRVDGDLKITFEIHNREFDEKAINHRIYLITGRRAEVTTSGIRSIA